MILDRIIVWTAALITVCLLGVMVGEVVVELSGVELDPGNVVTQERTQ